MDGGSLFEVTSIRAYPRFFVSLESIQGGKVQFPPDIAHQIVRVLRLKPGDRVSALPNDGRLLVVALDRAADGQASGLIEEDHWPQTELPYRVTVLQSLISREKSELAIQGCAQAGAMRIVFVPTERSVVRWDERKGLERLRRWQAIAREQAELSFRARYPSVEYMGDMAVALDGAGGRRLLLHEGESIERLGRLSADEDLTLIIGPEGGFGEAETARITAMGAEAVSVGPRVLRTESAALYVLGVIEGMMMEARR